jgi:hypothetical protein
MPHACKISEVIELLQQHQNDDFLLCSVWYEDDVHNVDDSVRQKRPERPMPCSQPSRRRTGHSLVHTGGRT